MTSAAALQDPVAVSLPRSIPLSSLSPTSGSLTATLAGPSEWEDSTGLVDPLSEVLATSMSEVVPPKPKRVTPFFLYEKPTERTTRSAFPSHPKSLAGSRSSTNQKKNTKKRERQTYRCVFKWIIESQSQRTFKTQTPKMYI